MIKPDPNIYKLLMKTYGLTPQKTVFIDDKSVNVEAANALGIQRNSLQKCLKAPERLRKAEIALTCDSYSPICLFFTFNLFCPLYLFHFWNCQETYYLIAETLRKLVVLSCVFLIISGIMLAYSELLPWVKESSATSLLHIWAGVFFISYFPHVCMGSHSGTCRSSAKFYSGYGFRNTPVFYRLGIDYFRNYFTSLWCICSRFTP